jgi:hypothetical protein
MLGFQRWQRQRVYVMTELRSRMKRLFLLAICSFGVLWPTVGFASLNSIACAAIYRGCKQGCATAQCVEDCQYASINCQLAGATKKQQTPPPCAGIRCSLPGHNPPTTVSDPNPKPSRPIKPVEPVNVSNPNKPTGPVILLRQNDSGGHEHRHGH